MTTSEQPASDQPIKRSTKVALTGILMTLLVVFAGTLFNTFGVNYGAEQAGLTGIVGIIASLKLLS